jgi:hypothetical protein
MRAAIAYPNDGGDFFTGSEHQIGFMQHSCRQT